MPPSRMHIPFAGCGQSVLQEHDEIGIWLVDLYGDARGWNGRDSLVGECIGRCGEGSEHEQL